MFMPCDVSAPAGWPAKSAFRAAARAIAVLRGTFARPLCVTAAGMSRADAAGLLRHMAGPHRMPDARRRADTVTRHSLPRAAATLIRPAYSRAHRGQMSKFNWAHKLMTITKFVIVISWVG
jgi:hypothetical protein